MSIPLPEASLLHGAVDGSPMIEAKALVAACAAMMTAQGEQTRPEDLPDPLKLQMDAGAAHQIINKLVIIELNKTVPPSESYRTAALAMGTAIGAMIVELGPKERAYVLGAVNVAIEGAIDQIRDAKARGAGTAN